MSEVTQYSRRGAVGVITIDSPPVNGLGHAVRAGVFRYLEAALADDDVAAVVIHGGGRMFSAGADIKEFGTDLALRSPTLVEVIDAAEKAHKPVVVAIHGVAAGGGCEFALGCHYRIAATDARIGLPEVNLGIIPGAGGTQRLPRLVGMSAALDFIVQGKLNPAAKAHDIGLVDELFEGDAADAGVAYANRLMADGRGPRRTRDQSPPAGEAGVLKYYRDEAASRARGVDAPLAAIDSIANTARLPFDEGMKAEREIFVRLVTSDQSKAMRHAFFAEREVGKIPDVPKDTPTRDIEKVGVVGCGNMGRGVAIALANAGIPVKIVETGQQALDSGLEAIEEAYESSVARGRLTRDESKRILSSIAGGLDLAELSDADVVIEAIPDDLALKKEIFATLDEVCRTDSILATTTSALDVDEIAGATARPGSVLGLHFFRPADAARLLEIARTDATEAEVIATAMALARRLRKTGVVVRACEGFVAHRMLAAYLTEACLLLEEGALPQHVDKAMYDFGFPMGPFTMADVAGLKDGYELRKQHARQLPQGQRRPQIEERVVNAGRLGLASGAGWYRYRTGSRTPMPDAKIENMILQTSEDLGIRRRAFSNDEIVERCLLPLVNEGAKILEERVAIRSSDIDVVWLYGYGFPRFRGGPMFWADLTGAREVCDKLVLLQGEHGARVKPAKLVQKLAEEGGKFSDS